MLRVYYTDDERAFAYSDFQMDGLVKSIRDMDYTNNDREMRTKTYNLVEAVRVAVYRGYLAPEDVTFYFEDRIIKVNKDARPINGSFPNTYWDVYLGIMCGFRNEKLSWEE